MRELQYQMCEVRKAQMAWYLNDSLYCDNGDDYYVAQMDLTTEHSKTGTFPDTYSNYQINNKTIKKANGHTLELRTIFQNMKRNIQTDGDNPINLTLSLVIKNSKGDIRAQKSEDFVVPNCTYNVDKARKSLSVSIDVEQNQFVSGYTIEGKLVNKDTGEVIQAFDAGDPGIVEPEPNPDPTPDPTPPTPDPDPEPATSTIKVQYGGHSAAQGATSITLNGAQVDDGTKVKAGDVLNFTTKHVEWGGNVVLVKSAKINNDQIFSSDNIYKGAWRSSPDSSVIWSNIVNSVDTFSYAIPENSSDEVVIDVQFQELSPIWRLFNPTTKEHVFTSSRAEYDFNVNGGFGVYYNGEGIDWFAPASSDTGIVRLFNAAYARRGLCAHYYCTKREAEEVRQAFPGEWEYDFNGSPVFYSGGDIPVYTAFKASENMSHHYTTNRFEYDTLASWGWDLEPQKSFVNGVATGIFRAAMKGM